MGGLAFLLSRLRLSELANVSLHHDILQQASCFFLCQNDAVVHFVEFRHLRIGLTFSWQKFESCIIKIQGTLRLLSLAKY